MLNLLINVDPFERDMLLELGAEKGEGYGDFNYFLWVSTDMLLELEAKLAAMDCGIDTVDTVEGLWEKCDQRVGREYRNKKVYSFHIIKDAEGKMFIPAQRDNEIFHSRELEVRDNFNEYWEIIDHPIRFSEYKKRR